MFVFEPRPYEDPDVQRLVKTVQAEYVQRYGSEDAATVGEGDFDAPAGVLLLGLLDGEPVAMGGWRRIELGGEQVAEIKRMFVVSSARRRGLSRMMLAEIESSATAAGFERFVLCTGPGQPEAIALYLSSGYELVPPFGHYADMPTVLFYAKTGTAHSRDLAAITRPGDGQGRQSTAMHTD
jgi:GNAT superfamily N-acetyltransferase